MWTGLYAAGAWTIDDYDDSVKPGAVDERRDEPKCREDGHLDHGWLGGTVVERRSLAGKLSLTYARPVADG